jgi:hypothetical protein
MDIDTHPHYGAFWEEDVTQFPRKDGEVSVLIELTAALLDC